MRPLLPFVLLALAPLVFGAYPLPPVYKLRTVEELLPVGRYLGTMSTMTFAHALETSRSLGLGKVALVLRFHDNTPARLCGPSAPLIVNGITWDETLDTAREILCETPRVYAVHKMYTT
jgi:hypothetical protein